MQRLQAGIVAVTLVLAAGCAGFGLGDGGEEVTPAPVPETASLPPGIGSDGVVRPALLGRAHEATLEGTGYTLIATRTQTYPNGSLRSRLSVRIELAPNRSHRVDLSVRGPGGPVIIGRPPADATFWSDGDRYLRRLERDNRTVYNEYQRPDGYTGTWTFWVEAVALEGDPGEDVATTFGAVRARTVDRTTGADGTEVFVVRGTSLADPQTGEEPTDWTDPVLLGRVESDGLVRSYRLSYTTALPDGPRVRVTRTVRFEAVGGTTVGRPPWYERAVAG